MKGSDKYQGHDGDALVFVVDGLEVGKGIGHFFSLFWIWFLVTYSPSKRINALISFKAFAKVT